MAQQTMYPAKNNSPVTVLTATLNSSGTTMTVDDPDVFPAAPNLAVLGSSDNAEIVLYTAINGNNITVVRGQHGTTAGVWQAGTAVARNFTAYDHDLFKENIEDLAASKQDNLTFDTVPTADSTNPVTSGGLKTTIDKKANLASPTFTGTPKAPTATLGTNTTQIATTAFVKSALDALDKSSVLYFPNQSVRSASSNSELFRITNSAITTDTVVLSCVFADNVRHSAITCTSYNGYIAFTGTCVTSTTADVILANKTN